MKSLLIHNNIVRLSVPFVSGILAYVLVLMFNNDLISITEYFVGTELYFCIAVSYLMHENSRFLLLLFENNNWIKTAWLNIGCQFLAVVVIGLLLSTLSINFYFKNQLGYDPNYSELVSFNIVFLIMPLIYCIVYVSEFYFTKRNNALISLEEYKKDQIEEDFKNFKKDINPTLLFNCLESLIVLNYSDKEKADELIDNMSLVYRHILNNKDSELIPLSEEIDALDYLVNIYNTLPYRNIKLNTSLRATKNKLIIPSALILSLQKIIKCLVIQNKAIEITIDEKADYIDLSYQEIEKIDASLNEDNFKHMKEAYAPYTGSDIIVSKNKQKKTISLPLLELAG